MARCEQEEPAARDRQRKYAPIGHCTARPREVTFGLRDLAFMVTFPEQKNYLP